MGTTTEDLKLAGGLVITPKVPHGLAAAVEGLTREVIRQRPEDIYVFAARHFEELLRLRDRYGTDASLPGRSGNSQTLREFNKELKKKDVGKPRRSNKEAAQQGGWSLSETAKVLERHRSIFGDAGSRRVSNEELRALASEKENEASREPRWDGKTRASGGAKSRRHEPAERFVRKSSRETEQGSKAGVKGAPKLMSPIPALPGSTGMLAKDIKTELRKNRISSRERRGIREKIDGKSAARIEGEAKRDAVASKRSSSRRIARERSTSDARPSLEERKKKTEATTMDNQKQKTEGRGGRLDSSGSRVPRTPSMDRVTKDYVVQRLTGSLDEPDYVEKVQGVIDGAEPTIKEKVEELKMGARVVSAGVRSRNGYDSVDESTSTSEKTDKSNQTDDARTRSALQRSRRSRRRSSSRSRARTSDRANDSLDGIETIASESTDVSKPTTAEDDLEKRLNETRNLLEDIDSAFPKSHEDRRARNRRSRSAKSVRGNGSLSAAESDVSDYLDVSREARSASKVSLPAVKTPSSRTESRSVSRSDSDNLVLPPISPETSKSAKLKEELILPVLPSPPSTADSKMPSTPDITDLMKTSREPETPELDRALLEDTAETELSNLHYGAIEEVFKDSLNVTPDVAVEAPPRPDSLEPEVGLSDVDEKAAKNDGGLENKPRAIELAEKSVEDALLISRKVEPDDAGRRASEATTTTNAEKVKPNVGENFGIEEKLREVHDTEKRIEEILDSEKRIEDDVDLEDAEAEAETEVRQIAESKSIEDQSEEVRDVEERIEEIFDPEAAVTAEEVTEEKRETKDAMETKVAEENSDENKEKPPADAIIENVSEIVTVGVDEADSKDQVRSTDRPVDQKEEKERGNTNEARDSIDKYSEKRKNESEEKSIEDSDEGKEEQRGGKNNENISTSVSASSSAAGPHSYILTEGSPYDIPDHVTTVIIPEREVQSPDSDTIQVEPEDGIQVRSSSISSSAAMMAEIGEKPAEPDEDGEKEKTASTQPPRNVLDNFGEAVSPEIPMECSTVDVDFIRGIKVGHELMISRQDLGEIREEEEEDKDTEVAQRETEEAEKAKGAVKAGTPMLEDILEKEEPSVEDKGEEIAASVDSSPEVLSGTDRRTSDSDSSGEAKETSATDDAPLEVSQEIEASTETRTTTTESSNEVKESTATDQSANVEDPRKHPSTPFVPELNLDSLQDTTVSSFKLTDDETGKGASEASPEGNEFTELSSDVAESGEAVLEEPCMKELVEIKEEPCEKVEAYATGPEERENDEKLVGEAKQREFDGAGVGQTSGGVKTVTDVLSDGGELVFSRVSLEGSSGEGKTAMERKEEGEEENRSKVEPSSDVGVEEAVAKDDRSPPKAEVVTDNLDDSAGRKEYHVFVPEVVGSQEKSSTTDSSTFNSAATKIQAGIRGFLTRRRLQSAQLRSSTLDSIPSIQESFAADATAPPEHLLPIEEVGLVQAATTIQSNYRGYKARQRLKREDAVQKRTLSIENAFGENGVQHTGEFHDCLPLPLLDAVAERTNESRSEGGDEEKRRRAETGPNGMVERGEFEAEVPGESPLMNDLKVPFADEESPKDDTFSGESRESKNSETFAERSDGPSDAVDVSEGETSSVAMVQHPIPPGPLGNQIVNLMILTGDESALQSHYLNFITSVEDECSLPRISTNTLDNVQSLMSIAGIESLSLDNPSDVSAGSDGVREPLALPGTPMGVVIEELPDSESVDTKTPVPYFFPETPESDNASPSDAGAEKTSREAPGGSVAAKTKGDSAEAELTRSSPVSFDDERAFLESSPISLDDPTSPEASRVSSGKKNRGGSARSLESVREETKDEKEKEDSAEKSLGQPPLVRLERELEDREASLASVSFSANADDVPGFGAENESLANKRKPILEVTVTPRDLLRSSSRSQDSQLSGDRVESPVTMMQIVPKSVEEKSEEGELAKKASDETRVEEPPPDAGENPRGDESKFDALPNALSKEDRVKEEKERASPKENESNSSARTSKTYTLEKDSESNGSTEEHRPKS